MPNIMSLAQVSEGEDAVFTAGIRATALAQIAGAGYAAPLSFVIPCEFYETFLEQSGLQHWIDHLYGRLPDTEEGYAEAYAELTKLFGQVQFSGILREEFLEAYESLAIDAKSDMDSIVTNESDPRVRIIPSPNYQSTKDFALALQQNVKGEEEFLQAIMKTWLTYFQPELVAERRLRGMEKDDFSLALLIEKEQAVDCSAEGTYTKARAAHPIKILSYRGVLDVNNAVAKDEHLLANDPLDVLKATVRKQAHKIVFGNTSGTTQKIELGEQGLNDTLHIRTLLEVGRLTKRAHITIEKDVHCYFGIKGEKAWLIAVEPKSDEQRQGSEMPQQMSTNHIEKFPMTTISLPQHKQEEMNPSQSAGELLQEAITEEGQTEQQVEQRVERDEELLEPKEQFEEFKETSFALNEQNSSQKTQEDHHETKQDEELNSEDRFASVDSLLVNTPKEQEEKIDISQEESDSQEESHPLEVVETYTENIEEMPQEPLTQEESRVEVVQEEIQTEGLGISLVDDTPTNPEQEITPNINSLEPEPIGKEEQREKGETLFDLFTPEQGGEAIPIIPVAEEEKQFIAPEAAKTAANIFVRHVANMVKEFSRKNIHILSERETLLLNAFENRLSQGEEATDVMVGLAWRAQHLINLRD